VKSHRVTVYGNLMSLNGERKVHRMTRAEAVRQWRVDAGWSAKAAHLPHLERVSIVAQPFQRFHVLADAGNHLPSIKAAIDGLVDVGVLDGDDGKHVTSLTLMAPIRAAGARSDWLTLELIEMAACKP
jgi:hypothetical protein